LIVNRFRQSAASLSEKLTTEDTEEFAEERSVLCAPLRVPQRPLRLFCALRSVRKLMIKFQRNS
jgi:hypothetical protein